MNVSYRKIAVIGMGYVGLSLGVLLAKNNCVSLLDIAQQKVNLVNQGKSPIDDREISIALESGELTLTASTKPEDVYPAADFVIVAVPTSFDAHRKELDTGSVESVIMDAIHYCPKATIVIKSTLPIGFTDRIVEKLQKEEIMFSPEFLREGKALYDNRHPSRIVIGTDTTNTKLVEAAYDFANLLRSNAESDDIKLVITSRAAAEAAKLFSNTYLAMRVAYFNELDMLAEQLGLDSADIIRAVCADPRIGDYYNNPSFGYGGYCLPKDTKQLAEIYKDNTISGSLIESIPVSNELRMDYIAAQIAGKLMQDMTSLTPVVGIYRLNAKKEGDNFRESAMLGVLNRVQRMNITTIAYEPLLPDGTEYFGCRIVNSLELFKIRSQIILANRKSSDLEDVMEKVYSRDIYMRD